LKAHSNPKKSLGQHFLVDKNIANKIVNSLTDKTARNVIEVGPGRGVLTEILYEKYKEKLFPIEIDTELFNQLSNKFPVLKNNIFNVDFLKFDILKEFTEQTSVIGNFPYNISNRIFFKILESKQIIPEVVCMIQKEVAERINSKSGNKVYGILSVLLRAFYNIEYLFTVNETVFDPPPKIKSAVIRLSRKDDFSIDCNEKDFFIIVKTAFNQRRKMLRNSLKSLLQDKNIENEILTKRPEQLSVKEFVYLTNLLMPITLS